MHGYGKIDLRAIRKDLKIQTSSDPLIFEKLVTIVVYGL
jgi:hypothetical protein